MTYDVEQKAQAIALVQSGTTSSKAAALLGLHERSVQLWVKEFRETSAKEGDPLLNDQSVRIAQRAGELIEVALEHIAEQGPEVAHKSLFVLNAIRGTSIDKMIASKRTAGETASITINFNVPTSETTPTMEADYREVAPELDAPADD